MKRSNAVRLVSTKGLSREEWLAVRNEGIGSSDAAAAIGLSPYKSQLELWLEKTGKKPPVDLSSNDAVFWGSTLEPVIAQVYADKSGAKVRRVNAILQHVEHSHMLANLDRVVLHPQDGSGILEVKTAGLWSAPFWEEGVPEMYQCQVLHQLAVTGRAWADVAVLIGGQEFRAYRIERDDARIEALIELEGKFWRYVKEDIPPPPDGSESSGKALAYLYPKHSDQVIDFSQAMDMNRVFGKLLAARREKDQAEEAEASLRHQLQATMGAANAAIFADGKVSWKTVKGGTGTDFKQLAEDHPDLVSRYTIQKPGHRRFLIQAGS